MSRMQQVATQPFASANSKPTPRMTPRPPTHREPTDQECLKLHEPITSEALNKAPRERDEARAEISAVKQEVLGVVTSIWKKEYQSEAPHWQPLPDLQGLISQLDNMYAGMRTQRDQANWDLRKARAEVERLRKRVEELEADQDYHVDMQTGNFTPTIATNDTSPEIFEAHGREWYKFTAGDQQPCAGNLKVCVLWPSDDEEIALVADLAQNFDWSRKPDLDEQVIGWRPADAPEKLERKGDER